MPTEPTIGATDADQVNPGETFERTLTYTDGGSAADLTGATLVISESSPASIATDMVITITDAAGGIATLALSPTAMENLSLGKQNWFRLKTTFSSGKVDVTPKIWIKIT